MFKIKEVKTYNDYKVIKNLIIKLENKEISDDDLIKEVSDNFVEFEEGYNLNNLDFENGIELENKIQEFLLDVSEKIRDSKKKLIMRAGNIKKY